MTAIFQTKIMMILLWSCVVLRGLVCYGFSTHSVSYQPTTTSSFLSIFGSSRVLSCCRYVQKNLDITIVKEEDEDDSKVEKQQLYVPPPDISIVDEEDEKSNNPSKYDPKDDDWYNDAPKETTSTYKPPEISIVNNNNEDESIPNKDTTQFLSKSNSSKEDYYNNDSSTLTRGPPRVRSKKKAEPSSMIGTSWMEKNAKFSNDKNEYENYDNNNNNNFRERQREGHQGDVDPRFPKHSSIIKDTTTFRQDFRQTRVFVQNIPDHVSWQDLKDHFRIAGNVIFASISVDVQTGMSKGHGIVQYETKDMAQNAIDIMANHPLKGSVLFVREDVQETKNPLARLGSSNSEFKNGYTPPTKWKCANEDNALFLSDDELFAVRNLIKARDDARRRKKFDVSDRIRDELKSNHGVFIDDRLKMWWTSIDGSKVPQSIHDMNGEGRWKLNPWRQIPTTPENDACVNTDLVVGLLKQRDIARREKDFSTADALLEQARTCPDGDLTLRIHDESRTWRVWTEERPATATTRPPQDEPRRTTSDHERHGTDIAFQECLEIVKEFAPDKMEEIKKVLLRFKGREFQVLKRLKQQYLQDM